MVNIDKLKGRIVEKRYTVEKLSNEMGIDKSTFYRKLNSNGESFTLKEVCAMINLLKISDTNILKIFFCK